MRKNNCLFCLNNVCSFVKNALCLGLFHLNKVTSHKDFKKTLRFSSPCYVNLKTNEMKDSSALKSEVGYSRRSKVLRSSGKQGNVMLFTILTIPLHKRAQTGREAKLCPFHNKINFSTQEFQQSTLELQLHVLGEHHLLEQNKYSHTFVITGKKSLLCICGLFKARREVHREV